MDRVEHWGPEWQSDSSKVIWLEKGRAKSKNGPVGKILKHFLTNWLKLLDHSSSFPNIPGSLPPSSILKDNTWHSRGPPGPSCRLYCICL